MVDISGFCDSRFDGVKTAFEKNFSEHDEIGASVAVSLGGEFIVDLWAGHTDRDGTQAWAEDTITNVWSSTKTMAAMCLLLLADRGEIDLHAPVGKYWPEFAVAGKDKVEVRHFLAHMAGLSGMDTKVEGDALYDWDWMVRELAAQTPWWEPGTASGYHALTQGHLIGEVVRRVSGQSLGAFFQKEIAEPLQADFHIGTPDALMPRISPLEPPREAFSLPLDTDLARRTFENPPVDAMQAMDPGWRRAEIPAANGHGNARSIVRAQTPMANGGEAFGKRILSEAGARRIFEPQWSGVDLVTGFPVIYGMGYGINNPDLPMSPNKNMGYWGGFGGSLVIVDQDARLCFSYVMNRMEPGTTGDLRGISLLAATYEALVAQG
ncbi:MAG: serine hydrolase domain-containing protein [Pseudomonadota bacterium]